jgi:acyl-CoA thioesterase
MTAPLSRLDGKFYGGTGLAVATALIEAETGRRALWASVQFASSASEDDDFDCRVEVLAEGRRSSQVRLTATVDGRLVFSAMGAAGESRTGEIEAQFGNMPDVEPPDNCPRWLPSVIAHLAGERPGWLAITDARRADEDGSMWMRVVDTPLSRTAVAFLADVVPSGVVRAAGRNGAGTSLDNCIRFGPDPEGDWLLVDIDPYFISAGYVHGGARLWSAGGRLLGVASQTAGLLLF